MKRTIPFVMAALLASACFRLLPSHFDTHKNDPRSPSVPHPPAKFVRAEPLPGFMKGLNIGNALDAPKEGEWGVYLRKSHFTMIADGGFDHVRLPIRFSAHAYETPPYTLNEDFMERVDWAIDQITSRHMSVIVDLHHYNELMKDPTSHRERFLALWKQIATRYKNRPKNVAFELLNEPTEKLDPQKLSELMNDALKLVRQTNPDRIVIVDSYFWSNAEHLLSLNLPRNDKNVVASFHCYTPILFTHQGSKWMDPEYKTEGIVFPGPPDKPVKPVAAAENKEWVRSWFESYHAKLRPGEFPQGIKDVMKTFDQASEYVEKVGHRVYMGEFGVIENADMKSRERYTRFVREEAERRGFGWAYWDDGGQMKIMDVVEGDFNELLRDALFK